MNAISYFLTEQNSIANENCKLYFDFETSSNLNENINNLSGLANYRGAIQSFQPVFWNNSGSGFFSGEFVSITGNNDTGVNIIHNDITFCLVYEHLSDKGGVLISTVETGTSKTFNDLGFEIETGIFKGFNFGFTANNRLFFEYYNNDALETYTSNFSLSQKASVFLTIFNNNINFGYYDFFKNQIVEDSYFIQSDFLFDYSSVYLGYNNNLNNTIFYNNKYTGYIDTFLIYSPSIFNIDLTAINSGLAHTYNSGTLVIENNSITGITGYASSITGYVTGVTGTVLIPTGVVTNQWGVEYTGFLESGVTGSIPQFVNSGITGIIEPIFNTGVQGESIILNRNFINSFGKQVINYLSKIDSDDTLELQLLTDAYFGDLNLKNIKAQYLPYVNKFSIPYETIDDTNSFIVFSNGQLQNTGISYLTGNGYTSSTLIINDYIIDENKEILFNNSYGENDSVFVDLTQVYDTGLYIKDFFVESGNGEITLTGWNDNLNNIYFNGQKLINGFHYKTLLPKLQDSLSGTTGYYDSFGRNFSINTNGEILVVGAPSKRNNSSQTVGSIEIFKRISDKYNLIQGITGTIAGEAFGNNLSTSSDGRIIAVSNTSQNNGRIWIYQSNNLSNWVLHQTLSGNVGAQRFGERLAISPDGTVLTVGSRLDVVATNSTGSMWIYTGGFNRTWNQTQKITGLMNSVGLVDIGWPANQTLNSGGNTLCIGFDSKKVSMDEFAGVVSVYTGLNGVYNFSQELIGDPIGQSSGDLFGRSLAITDVGNILAVGSLHDQNFENRTLDGALFIFETGSDKKFFLKQKLRGDLDPFLRQNDRFGYFTDMNSDGSIIITSSQHDEGSALPLTNQSVGAFWIYRKNTFGTWDQIHKEIGTGINNFFGLLCKLSRDGSTIVIGEQPFLFGLGSRGSTKIYSQDIFSVNDIIFDKQNPLYNGTTGILSAAPKLNNYRLLDSDKNSYLIPTKYLYNLSEIYKNGIRQTLDTDYLELAKLDTNTGVGFFDIKSSFIYNNEGLFPL
jgi:hypothetical protein